MNESRKCLPSTSVVVLNSEWREDKFWRLIIPTPPPPLDKKQQSVPDSGSICLRNLKLRVKKHLEAVFQLYSHLQN